MNSIIKEYLQSVSVDQIDTDFLAYLANLSSIASVSPKIASSIVKELADQRSNLKLIASENYCSLPVQLAMANLLTDKYAEGFPGHRFYAGCENVDDIEALAVAEACKLFGAEHAYVQPHSGADANLVAYLGILQARVGAPILDELKITKLTDLSDEQWARLRKEIGSQRLLGMDYYSGGHLTHGYRYNLSAQLFEAYTYSVDPNTGLLDYEQIEKIAEKVKPLILLAGYSAYPRAISFRRLREIAGKVGAVFMVDMAHFAGLVAGGVFQGDENPVLHADVVTTTTHKTLRGPRGGMVLSTKEFGTFMDKGCPLCLGGPLSHIMASKALCLIEANRPEFKEYAKTIVVRARALAEAFLSEGISVATGGTDNHLMLLDVRKSFGLTGRQAESAVRECGVTLNRNSLPFDPNGAWFTSGLRIGTPAVTTLGMSNSDMKEIASIIKCVLSSCKPAAGKQEGTLSKSEYVLDVKVKEKAKARVKALLDSYPVYKNIDLSLLKKYFG